MIKKIGEYNHYEQCRGCFSSDIIVFIDLGYVPLAGGFLKSKNEFEQERFYPLQICFCPNCFLIQTNAVIDRTILFGNYFYFSSAIQTLVDHFQTVADEISQRIKNHKNPFVIEIGCNDGSLLSALQTKKIAVLGIDPAKNIVSPLIANGTPIINDYFTKELAAKIKKKYHKADVIFSSNTFAHIEDMHNVLDGIKLLLKQDGILIFEVHYLGNLIHQVQYDMIYHEHQYYYSLLALKNLLLKHDLEIFDVLPIPIHAGSMRYYVKYTSSTKRNISQRVYELANNEIQQGFQNIETFLTYGKKVEKTKADLRKLLIRLQTQHKKIAGYGASGRSTIIMNYCGLDRSFLEYIIDDAPAKQGTYTPGTHLQIINRKILLHNKTRPAYVVVFAWSFLEEIRIKNKDYLANGGKFIIPLPKVKIY